MTITRTPFTSHLFAAAVTMLAALPAAAQDATYLPEDASYCDMFRGLSRTVPVSCASDDDLALAGVKTRSWGGATRGIRLHEPTSPSGTADGYSSGVVEAVQQDDTIYEGAYQGAYEVAAVEQADAGPLEIAMRVQFEFDSFRLTREAKATLDELASVLNNELMRDVVVAIEGHADASGPDLYNLSLSQLRARAVRAYLIETHGVASRRLEFTGKGEEEPYDPSNPYAGINRRVEFRNLSG